MKNQGILQEIEQLRLEIAEIKSNKGYKGFIKKSFSKMNVIFGVMITIIATSFILYAAADFDVPFTFGYNDPILASETNTNFSKIYSLVEDLDKASIPIGTVSAYLKNLTNTPTLSDNWVECNGQVISDSGSVYNGVTLPDLNGEGRFLRGGSTSGVLQDDQLQGHYHQTNIFNVGTSGSNSGLVENINASNSITDDHTWGANSIISNGTNGTPRVGSETRSINMSVIWIIKIK